LLNSHKKFAGMQFAESDHLIEGIPSWIECTLHRWDRCVPTTVREYFEEVRGSTQSWITHPRRMLRHKALVQCARLAFGLVGIYDHDEAQRICNESGQSADQSTTQRPETPTTSGLGVAAVKRHLGLRAV
ncbi:MAG: recombinase RecT, partial [Limnohabitans sp.]|nr:recombinase RecT [Limnohabitans sp.]